MTVVQTSEVSTKWLASGFRSARFCARFYDDGRKLRKSSEAISLSRKTVSGNFKEILLLFLILAGINLLGLMALGVGILLTMPFSFCVLYAAFDDIIGIPN